MKKSALAVALISCFAMNFPSYSQNNSQTQTTVDRTLKDRERDVYESIKSSGGKSNVTSSTVTISDTGEESVIENTFVKDDAKSVKKLPVPAVVIPAAKNSVPVTSGVQTYAAGAGRGTGGATASELKVYSSDGNPVMDAMDLMSKPKVEATRPRQISRESVAKQADLDKQMPEAGIQMIEKTSRREVIEKMIPPSDEMIYGALRQQGQGGSEVRSRANSGVSGASDEAVVLEAIQGVNEIVTIGKNDLNRFVTPFDKVKVRTAAGEDELVSKVDGNIVYLGATKRSGVFLTEVGTDRAISLTLVPDDVPPRDIYIKLSRSGNIPGSLSKITKTSASGKGVGSSSSTSDGVVGKASSHVEFVKDVMRDIALGKIPNGYTMMTPKQGEFRCQMPGLRMRLGQAIEGSANKIMVFRAENVGSREVVVDEQYCYKRGVLAVSAWPEVVVQPGEATEIFVLMKMDEGQPASAGRPSLIGREVISTDEE